MKKSILLAAAAIFSALAHAQSKKLLVSDITASGASPDKITVSWTLPEQDEKEFVSSLIIYRGTRPFTSYSELKGRESYATVDGSSESFTDTVSANNDFYYTVISVVSKKNGTDGDNLYFDEAQKDRTKTKDDKIVRLILPGKNATIAGASVPKRNTLKAVITQDPEKTRTYSGSMREKPLPRVDILDDGISRKKSSRKISRKAENQARKFIPEQQEKKPEPLQPHIFEEDLVSPEGGDEYLLFEILRTSFIKRNYTNSKKSLKKFLRARRETNVADRATFYLGESLYYTGCFGEALKCFISVADTYPALSKKWIESSLDQFNPKIPE